MTNLYHSILQISLASTFYVKADVIYKVDLNSLNLYDT